MKVEVVTPEDQGDVMGDVSRRRGVLQGSDTTGDGKIINAMIPLAKCSAMRRAALDVQGRATFTMEFDHYRSADQHRRSRHQEGLSLAQPLLKPLTNNQGIEQWQRVSSSAPSRT
jgi:translation elongation factor EF-G